MAVENFCMIVPVLQTISIGYLQINLNFFLFYGQLFLMTIIAEQVKIKNLSYKLFTLKQNKLQKKFNLNYKLFQVYSLSIDKV